MNALHRAAHRPPHRDVIVEDHPDTPLPPRRVALQAMAATMPVESRQSRLLPLVASGLGLPIAWLLLPEESPGAHLILAVATMLFIGASAWVLRHGPDAEGAAREGAGAWPARTGLAREFERFMEDGIAASRRRGRSVALLRFAFMGPLLDRDPHGTLETIAETLRDATRAYDFVHVPGDGSILVFIAHLPTDMQAGAVARRILDDLQMTNGPASRASRVNLQLATLAEAEDMHAFLQRLARAPVVQLPR